MAVLGRPVPFPLGDLAPLPAKTDSPRALYETGITAAALGDTHTAIAALRGAVALDPALPDAWRHLGEALRLDGKWDQAEAAYANHARTAACDSGSPSPKPLAGAKLESALRRLEQEFRNVAPDIAESMLRDRIRAAPTDAPALAKLARLAMDYGYPPDAERLAVRALELAPGLATARHTLAVSLFRQSKAAACIPHIEALVGANPRDISYRTLFASALASVGEFPRAVVQFEAILRQAPRVPEVWLSYAQALRSAGRRDDATRAYRTCIGLAPAMGQPYYNMANLTPTPFNAEEIAAMHAVLAKPGLDVEDRYHLHYALGRTYERTRNFADSFTHYAEGARLRRAASGYDPGVVAVHVDQSMQVFTTDFFEAHAADGCPDPAPIFIIGLPRAGSTLIEQILASHSAIEGTQELPEIIAMARDLGAGATGYPACMTTLTPGRIAALGAQYIERTRIYRKSGKAFFVDKMPGNWEHVGLIHTILPNAKIIDARRQPMANCFGAFKQLFAGLNYTYGLADLGEYYRHYARLIEWYEAVLPGRIHRVDYENLVADTESEIRRLLAFCAVPFEPGCLRFWETARAVSTASAEQVRQPIFRDGLDQWRNYEPWLGPLKEALGVI